MQVPQSDRLPLVPSVNFNRINKTIYAQGTFPLEAIILDEDLPTNPLLRELRRRNPRFKQGRGILGRFRRVQVLYAGHLFDTTHDKELLKWCSSHNYILLTCNVTDFEQLHQQLSHSGLIICTDQGYPVRNATDFADRICNELGGRRKQEFVDSVCVIP